MNKNQIKGEVKDIAGKVQEQTGHLLGNKTQEAKGLGNQVVGKAQKALGDLQQAQHKAAGKPGA